MGRGQVGLGDSLWAGGQWREEERLWAFPVDAADLASLECHFAFPCSGPGLSSLGVPASIIWPHSCSPMAEPGLTKQEGRPLGCLLALVVFDPVTFSVGRSNAGDRQGLLENDLAGELGQHRHGHEPRGSGQGKPLPLAPPS